MSTENVAKRMRQLRIAYEGDKRGSSSRFARRFDWSPKRWSNYENGFPVPRDVALELVQKFPGLTESWIWRGETSGLTLEMLRRLGEDGSSSSKSA